MAARRRILKPLLYASGVGAVGTIALYTVYRPRDIPGTEAASVPPPTYGEGGVFRPPRFPYIKSREEQIADLKRSAGIIAGKLDTVKGGLGSWIGGSAEIEQVEEEPYDLLIIGGGATGSGIALDAATRGLKVALVERDDFSSGTSSKSTKLVHGGVRYLEKAVWNLDYNQWVYQIRSRGSFSKLTMLQICACSRGSAGETVFLRYRTTSISMAPHYDSN